MVGGPSPMRSPLARRLRRRAMTALRNGCPVQREDVSRDPPAPAREQVLLARPRGFCAGVERAVRAVETALELHGSPVYVRKQIVHNKHVVTRLEQRGAVFVEETDDVPRGAVMVFSAHGVSPKVRAEAASRGLRTIDATCPLVAKVHAEVRRFASEDYNVLLLGHEGHDEVIGTTGEAPARVQVIDGPDAVARLTVPDESKLVWLSQTTLAVDETMRTVRRLQDRFPQLRSPPSEDICYATQNRQQAVKEIAPRCDLVLVVGAAHSANSALLVDVALEASVGQAHLVDAASDIDESWLVGATTVGVTAGASAPEELVASVLGWLGDRGYGDVAEVGTGSETQTFSLPRELRDRHLTPSGDVAGGRSR